MVYRVRLANLGVSMPSPVVYTFILGSQRRELLFERVLPAVYSAVMDLHEERAVPLSIYWGGRRLYDREALEEAAGRETE
jgi:hypothetical protein